MSFTFVGIGHSAIPDSLVGSIVISPGQSISPKMSTSFKVGRMHIRLHHVIRYFGLCRPSYCV